MTKYFYSSSYVALLFNRIVTSITWAVRLSWLQNAYSRPLFQRAILTCKVRQTDLVFGL